MAIASLWPVYLDGHATTPLAPEAAVAMEPWWHSKAANAHSPHLRGTNAAMMVERARAAVATLVGADPQEIIFTSGATESNNLVVQGVARAAIDAGDHRREIIVSAIEHKSVLDAASSLKEQGFHVMTAPVGRDGRLLVDEFLKMVSKETLLVSIMAANNEVGTIQPLSLILPVIRSNGAMIHVDAAQMVGKVQFNVSEFDFASISSHKMYGPMGIGALFISGAAQYRPRPLFFGGGQEAGIRPGTLPNPLIAGFGEAARVATNAMSGDAAHAQSLSDRFLEGLCARQVQFTRNASGDTSLPGSLSLIIHGVDAASLIDSLSNKVCISDGSACSSGQIQRSHVLKSMKLSDQESSQTIRIYFNRYNTESEIDFSVGEIVDAIRRLTLAHWTDHPVRLAHERPSR